MAATQNNVVISGTWSTSQSGKMTAMLVLNFVEPLKELNDDWDVAERSATSIKLENVSGGSGDTAQLTLEKYKPLSVSGASFFLSNYYKPYF